MAAQLLVQLLPRCFQSADLLFQLGDEGLAFLVGVLQFGELLEELFGVLFLVAGLTGWGQGYMWELTRDFIVTDPDISIYKLVSIMRVVLPLLLLLLTAVRTYDWTNLTDTLNYYLHNGGFAGGVLRVANATHTILSRPFGTFSHNSLPRSSPPFTNDTIFDIASLTKVTATLSCIMRLVDLAKIHPDDPVTKYIPEYGNHGKEVTTLKNLLLHNAGLLPDPPSSLPKNKPDIMNWIYNCALDYPVGHNFVYSDISFILLAEISERVTKKPVNVYAKELFEWMGMYNSTYLPDLERELHRIAPTEYSCKSLPTQPTGRKW